MSVLKTAYAVPTKVMAVFNYLLNCKGYSQERSILENDLSPFILRSPDGQDGPMVKGVIKECLDMKLIEEIKTGTSNVLALPKDILSDYGLEVFDKERFRQLLTQTIISKGEINPNDDLCHFLAWYQAQDIYIMHGDWGWMDQRLHDVFREKRMFTDSTKWNQFEYWVTFMGLAWNCGSDMFPDPTRYISMQLKMFSSRYSKPIPIDQFLNELAESCPIFPGGQYYKQMEKYLSPTPQNEVCSAVSNALIRLEEKKLINLIDAKADANLKLLRTSSRHMRRVDKIEIN